MAGSKRLTGLYSYSSTGGGRFEQIFRFAAVDFIKARHFGVGKETHAHAAVGGAYERGDKAARAVVVAEIVRGDVDGLFRPFGQHQPGEKALLVGGHEQRALVAARAEKRLVRVESQVVSGPHRDGVRHKGAQQVREDKRRDKASRSERNSAREDSSAVENRKAPFHTGIVYHAAGKKSTRARAALYERRFVRIDRGCARKTCSIWQPAGTGTRVNSLQTRKDLLYYKT